jgi:hypothetical protein
MKLLPLKSHSLQMLSPSLPLLIHIVTLVLFYLLS